MNYIFLFIFESIGTQELILIGIIALIFLGPRKLPEIARKLGKIMAEFRSTTNEFKATWEREVNLEAEAEALRTMMDEPEPVARTNSILPPPSVESELPPPEIKEVDPAVFETVEASETDGPGDNSRQTEHEDISELQAKENWL